MLDLVCLYLNSFVKIGDKTYKSVKSCDHKTFRDTKVIVTNGRDIENQYYKIRTRKNFVSTWSQHLGEYETLMVAHMTPRESFTAVAYRALLRVPQNTFDVFCAIVLKTRFFTFILPSSASEFNSMTNYH